MGLNLDTLLQTLREFRDERDWAQFHTPKDLAISISIEASELLELFQWRSDGHSIDGKIKEKAADEAADVLLYTLMMFDKLGLDPLEEAKNKIEKNRVRFPVSKIYGKASLD